MSSATATEVDPRDDGNGIASTNNKKRKTSRSSSSSSSKKRYGIIEAYEENERSKPFLKQAIIVDLRSDISTADTIRQTIEKYAPEFQYANADISSLTTGRGTSLGKDFLNEPVHSIGDLLEDGEKWHLKVTLKRTDGDFFSPLPDKIVKHIFGYVQGVRDLLSCERSCSRFRHMLADDDVWRYCHGADSERVEIFRENAFIELAVAEVWKEQQLTRNIILSVLSPETIRSVFNEEIVGSMLGRGKSAESNVCDIQFDIRGDTLQYALDIAEDFVLEKLHKALLISVEVALAKGEKNDYPDVTFRELLAVRKIVRNRIPYTAVSEDLMAESINSHCDFESRFQLARRLGRRSGVVKMTDDAMLEIVFDVFMMLAHLLQRPMIVHEQLLIHQRYKFEKSKDLIDLWDDIPPAIKSKGSNGSDLYECVIVPGQIEEYAIEDDSCSKRLCPAYGRGQWALSAGQTLEKEVEAAKRRYMIKPEPLSDDEESLSSNDSDFRSMSDSTEFSGFSEYDDEDCPDEGDSDDASS